MAGKVYVFAGDSITDCGHLFDATGIGDGYVSIIQKYLPEDRVINSGFDGYIAQRLVRIWKQICVCHDPDVVTLLVGVNDVCAYFCGGGGYGAEAYGQFLEEMVKKTRQETHAQMVLMEPFLFPKPEEFQNWFAPLEEFRREMKRVAEKYNCIFIPLWDVFEKAQEKYEVDELTVDGIHLTKKGHEILSETWIRAVFGTR